MLKTSIEQWQQGFNKTFIKDFPTVIANTLNTVADEANVQQWLSIKKLFNTRNNYTKKSLRVSHAYPKRNIAKIYSTVGSVSPYLGIQEKGGIRGTNRDTGTYTVPVSVSSREGGVFKNRMINKMKWNNIKGSLAKRKRKGAFRLTNKQRGIDIILKENSAWYKGSAQSRYTAVRLLKYKKIKIKATHWHKKAIDFTMANHTLIDAYTRQVERTLKKNIKS